MGLAGELVKKVFCRIRSSAGGHDHNEKSSCLRKNSSNMTTKLRFCGDVPESILDDDDDDDDDEEEEEEEEENNVVSVNSSEALKEEIGSGLRLSTATTSATETFAFSVETQKNKEVRQESSNEQKTPRSNQLKEEDAATIIQSAIRGFLARRQIRQLTKIQVKEISSSGGSPGTSTEVQAGDSVRSLKLHVENTVPSSRKVRRKSKPHAPLQKEWDDSTLSSNILQQKIQNRLEAMTRRDRALAYAFAQQLRTCSDKRRSSQCESEGSNMGWSWLERWMATRIPDSSSVEECLGKKSDTVLGNRRSITLFRKQLDLAIEEESCASNDIDLSFENHDEPTSPLKNTHGPFKDQKNVMRRNNLLGNHHTTRLTKVVKIESLREAEKTKRMKLVRSKISKDGF